MKTDSMITITRGEQSFTLIEMMIVIVVIAILLGALLPSFRGAQDEAFTQRARSELRTLATAIESYNIHTGDFPVALADLTTATPRVVTVIPFDPFQTGGAVYAYGRTLNLAYWGAASPGVDRVFQLSLLFHVRSRPQRHSAQDTLVVLLLPLRLPLLFLGHLRFLLFVFLRISRLSHAPDLLPIKRVLAAPGSSMLTGYAPRCWGPRGDCHLIQQAYRRGSEASRRGWVSHR